MAKGGTKRVGETELTFRAQVEAWLDAGENWPGDEQVAHEVGCAKSTVAQHRRGWQRVRGIKHGGNGHKRLPEEVLTLIWEARKDEGYNVRPKDHRAEPRARGVEQVYDLL